MRHIRIPDSLLGGFAVLLLAAGSTVAVARDDAAVAAKAKAEASAKVNADIKAREKAETAAAKAQATAARTEAKAKAKAEGAAARAKEEARAKAEAEARANARVNLDGPSLRTVKDRVFGTPDNGLLDGKGSFNLHAENMTMTSAESTAFFTSANSQESFAAMVRGAEALRGAIWLEGKVDGEPFEMKLAGRELKVDGLTLTASQREALVTELRAIDGLKEMKIEATVDGQQTVTKVAGGQQKLELLGSKKTDREATGRSNEKARVETGVKVDARERVDGPVRVDGSQRIEGTGRVGIERVVPSLGGR